MFWSTPARWTRSTRKRRGLAGWLPAGAWCCRAGDGSSWAGQAFPVTVVAPIVRTRHGQGLCGSPGGAVAAAARVQAPKRSASGSIPPAPGSPDCGRNRSAASSPARSALSGAPRRSAPAGPRWHR